MDWLITRFSEEQLYALEEWIGEWFFYAALGILALELCSQVRSKSIRWKIVGDALTNFVTLGAFIGIALLFFGVYIGALYWFYEYASVIQLPNTLWVLVLAVLLADFIYYWEHRFMLHCTRNWSENCPAGLRQSSTRRPTIGCITGAMLNTSTKTTAAC